MGRWWTFGMLLGLGVEAAAQEAGEGTPSDAVKIHGDGHAEDAPAEDAPAEAAPAEPAPASDEDAAEEALPEAPDAEWEAAPEPQPEPAPEVRAAPTAPRALRRVSGKLPTFPDELAVIHKASTVRCDARVWVDDKGSPLRIVLTECPDGLHLPALSAMSTWKWEKPSGRVPPGGVETTASTAFERKNKKYYPGVTYFRSPEEVSAEGLTVVLRSGSMPRFPRAVVAGDDVCLLELEVDAAGRTRSAIVDECTTPYEIEMRKAVKSWRWWWVDAPAKGETATVVTEVVFRI